jgi:hypothetical protein
MQKRANAHPKRIKNMRDAQKTAKNGNAEVPSRRGGLRILGWQTQVD